MQGGRSWVGSGLGEGDVIGGEGVLSGEGAGSWMGRGRWSCGEGPYNENDETYMTGPPVVVARPEIQIIKCTAFKVLNVHTKRIFTRQI